jgi:hypothetical protein
MLSNDTITQRLEEMARQSDPSDSLWPENCAGSRRALTNFLGPSPGGKKEAVRRAIRFKYNKPLWNETYVDPLNWSTGFKTSFKPIVEELFRMPYEDSAKLIARINMDWQGNPESEDVSIRYMLEGSSFILPVLFECDPELIIPMDKKTFNVFQIALANDGFVIIPPPIGQIKIKIFEKNGKISNHTGIMAFKAEKKGKSLLVIKLLQHPARIFNVEYARRVGKALHLASQQIWNGDTVNIDIT